MHDEKDMIEINLNTPTEKVSGVKGFNYFGSIRFAKTHNGGFPYEQYQNQDEEQTTVEEKSPTFYSAQKISCLRQIYCPECQQRLDEENVLIDRHLPCCITLYSISRFHKYFKRHGDRRIYCKNCGGDMGYFKHA